MKKILLIGGSGNLGSELLKINSDFLTPSSKELDITNTDNLKKYFKGKDIAVVVNCAAITNTSLCEKEISKSLLVNTSGPINLMIMQEVFGFKIVHISTDYVFDGEKGNYKTSDPINPISNYAKSKAAAELITRMNQDNLIIRTSFFPRVFPHDKAFVDQYTSKDFVDIIAPNIYKLIMSECKGVVHVGTEKDTVYNKVKKRKPDVQKISRDEIKSVFIPRDVSLF
jgi:dTDP-4-dehydrorhamnose reductase